MHIVHFQKPSINGSRVKNINATSLKSGRYACHGRNRQMALYIPLSPLQMETETKILIKMCPLSTDGAVLILAFRIII